MEAILSAARATDIPVGWSGFWYVEKTTFSKATPGKRGKETVLLEPGTYTYLRRLTDATIYNSPPGEVVMEDTPYELCTHLQFMLQAHGDVLVTGLGLGCVTRGLLANHNVRSVTCIEKSASVLKLVQPHINYDNLTIIHADALEWVIDNDRKFDCAWHDLWTNQDDGDPMLDLWHAQLILRCRENIDWQDAWSIDRTIKKWMMQRGIQLSPTKRSEYVGTD